MGIFQCVECEKVFYSENSLKSHLTATGHMSGIKCGRCGSQFLNKSQLIEHLERIHKIHGKVLDNIKLDFDPVLRDNNSDNGSVSSFLIKEDKVEEDSNAEETDDTLINDDISKQEAEMTEENSRIEEDNTDAPEEETVEPVVEEPVEVSEEPVKERVMPDSIGYSLVTDKPEALIVACIDPRFRDSFVKFGKDEFGSFVFLSVPGGPGPLALDMLPKAAETLRRQIKFILKETGIKKVAIVNHDDCLWYKHNEGYYTFEQDEQQKQDLLYARSILEERFEDVEIICYQAVLNNDVITFEEVK